MMKTPFARLLLFLLAARLLPAADPTYRLEYQIRGGAISRLLLFFPIRVFYDAAAAVDLTAHAQAGVGTCFAYAGLPRPAYIIRTLGFSGKTLALLTVGGEEAAGGDVAGELFSQWRKQEPEFAARVKTVKKFPHRLLATGPQSFAFDRDDRRPLPGYRPRPGSPLPLLPGHTGIYFNVFPMLADLLKLLNHPFVPAATRGSPVRPFPAEWSGDAMDLSGDLNRAAGLAGKSRQVAGHGGAEIPVPPALSRHRQHAPEAIEICGECFPDVSIWKGFMIREMFRRVRLRPADRRPA